MSPASSSKESESGTENAIGSVTRDGRALFLCLAFPDDCVDPGAVVAMENATVLPEPNSGTLFCRSPHGASATVLDALLNVEIDRPATERHGDLNGHDDGRHPYDGDPAPGLDLGVHGDAHQRARYFHCEHPGLVAPPARPRLDVL